jgi:hypothetical protein
MTALINIFGYSLMALYTIAVYAVLWRWITHA